MSLVSGSTATETARSSLSFSCFLSWANRAKTLGVGMVFNALGGCMTNLLFDFLFFVASESHSLLLLRRQTWPAWQDEGSHTNEFLCLPPSFSFYFPLCEKNRTHIFELRALRLYTLPQTDRLTYLLVHYEKKGQDRLMGKRNAMADVLHEPVPFLCSASQVFFRYFGS